MTMKVDTMVKTSLDAWSDICRSWFPASTTNVVASHPVHACIIDGGRVYIHAPNLEHEDPNYFACLKAFAKEKKAGLRADRRGALVDAKSCRRRRFLPIIFLTLSLTAAESYAELDDVTLNIVDGSSIHQEALEQNHFPQTHSTQTHSAQTHLPQTHLPQDSADGIGFDDFVVDYDTEISGSLEEILRAHYVVGKDDPVSMNTDIGNMAKYYSAYPETVALLNGLAGADWELRYAPHTFQTDVGGSRLAVDKITVYFDPRSGAKLKFYDKCSDKVPFCVASPADALLHEFLHVDTIVNDLARYISDGGLNRTMYPVTHEAHTIHNESLLYSAMSLRDKRPRPIRSEHSGRHILVSCVTCLN
ncbi:MAG: hypothetical protein ACI93R_001501 [Flavobacteriales bacterium]|jgi:hypothetical protein